MGHDQQYSVKQLAKLAGVSVRTLHVYDRMSLLKPSNRTRAGYRQYGVAELLRLQQILFYKELDMPLREIGRVLDEPGFDLIEALNGHKAALIKRRDRLDTLLSTIDHTIEHLTNKTMLNTNFEKLYEGIPREEALAWRKEAIEKWGEENIVRNEEMLLNMPAASLEQLKAEQADIRKALRALRGADPKSAEAQQVIARHYTNIRGFWGLRPDEDLKAERYRGLAELYVTDERYLAEHGQPDPILARFVREAMLHFADTQLV